MSKLATVAKAAGVAAGAVSALSAAGYAGQRISAARLRRAPDGDAARALEAPLYVDRRLDAFDGGSIYLVEDGDGPPILFSHGVTNSIRTWFHQLDELPDAGFHTIAYDHRGHGHSQAGEAGHSIDNLALDMRTVIEALDLRNVVIVGHSMGGVATQAFVTQFPEQAADRVAGIVLLSTLARAPLGSWSTRTKGRIEQITNHAPDMSWVWSSPNLGLVLARLGFGRDPHPSHVELVRQMLMECPPLTRLEAPRALIGFDLTDALPSIRIPTLVVAGTADLLTPPALAREIVSHIPGARLELMRDGGHMLMLERARELNEMIIDFARQVGAAPVDRSARRDAPERMAR